MNGTYKIGYEVVPGNVKTVSYYRPSLNYRELDISTILLQKTLLLRNYPPVFLLTYGDAEACPNTV